MSCRHAVGRRGWPGCRAPRAPSWPASAAATEHPGYRILPHVPSPPLSLLPVPPFSRRAARALAPVVTVLVFHGTTEPLRGLGDLRPDVTTDLESRREPVGVFVTPVYDKATPWGRRRLPDGTVETRVLEGELVVSIARVLDCIPVRNGSVRKRRLGPRRVVRRSGLAAQVRFDLLRLCELLRPQRPQASRWHTVTRVLLERGVQLVLLTPEEDWCVLDRSILREVSAGPPAPTR
jgi:hypothetical protein